MLELTRLNSDYLIELSGFLETSMHFINPEQPTKEDMHKITSLIKSNNKLVQIGCKLNDLIKKRSGNGYFYFDLNDISDSISNQKLLNFLFICLIGTPIWLSSKDPFWFELKVKVNEDPGKTHGVGENKLHMDMVGYSKIPRINSFHCIKNDPNGGGMTFLSDLDKAISRLTEEDIALLSKPYFKYWADQGVEDTDVGTNKDSFPIIDIDTSGERIYRFTSKMYYFMDDNKVFTSEAIKVKEKLISSFLNFWKAAEELKEGVILKPGHLLIFDQLRLAHGRGKLGEHQQIIPIERQRLISQCYAH